MAARKRLFQLNGVQCSRKVWEDGMGMCDDCDKNGKRLGFGCGKFPEVSFNI